MSKKAWFFLLALLAVHLGILTNIRFTAWPEMLSYPYLFLNKFKLYTDFVYPYPPLLTLILAGFYKVLGFKILTLKLVSWLFIIGSDVFLFLIVKKIIKKGLLAFLLLVPYLFIQSFLDGNMLWFDNALVLPVTASLYYLISWTERKRSNDLILASLFLTAGVFIKQTAVIYFAAFLIFYFLIRRGIIWQEIKRILLPSVLAGLVFLVYLAVNGTLKDFWLWSFYYPLTFWSKFPGYQDLVLTIREKSVFGLTVVPFLGALLVKGKIFKDKVFILTLAFLAASILAVYPRFTYFHLQPFFAIVFIGFAIIFSYLKKYWYVGVIGLISILAIYPTLSFSFNRNVRFNNGEDQKIIKMVSALSTKEEKVFLPGLYSSVYVFADRLPPKPWADNFGWYFEIPGWQEYTIEKFEEDPPAKIFYKVPEEGNWFDLGVYRPQKLVEYMKDNYYLDSVPLSGVELWKRKD